MGFFIGHVGLHVKDIDAEIAFLEMLGATVTSRETTPRGRIAFVSIDGETHHNFALFEDGELLPSGDSKKEKRGLHHIALRVQTRSEVDGWVAKLKAYGLALDGPHIQGPEGGGLVAGSSSYSVFFNDPNGVSFEIFAEPRTVAEWRAATQRETEPA
ncbi:MAG TPA: VOC family protein [Stellaceae bacterium]|nr:VOC family protein [Stellaceae bacterium]